MEKRDQTPLRRVVVDFKKLTPEILALVMDKYPDGYEYRDIITFKNAKNESVKAIEINTHDTKYLVKISEQLQEAMEEYDEDDYDDDLDDQDEDADLDEIASPEDQED
ncbi:MAG: hypothetical protein WBG46_12755 [Nonlabens sp.]